MSIQVNGYHINHSQFSGGECHINIQAIKLDQHTYVHANLNQPDKIMQLLLTVDAIRRIVPTTQIELTIPYFPYARQDRVCNPGEAFSLEVMANLINQLHCDQVTVYDPHSSVLTALLNNIHVITQVDIITQSPLAKIIQNQPFTLVGPDAGSKAKVAQLAKALNVDAIYCTKVRNSHTRQIEQSIVPDTISNQHLMIIDDICDGGRTFNELAKKLKPKGVESIYLYVTHGLFSRGFDQLKTHFKHIYCYHTLQPFDNQPSFLTTLKEN